MKVASKSVRACFLNFLFSLVAMSRDSKQGKEPKSQKTQGNTRRRRRDHGEPNWYDMAVNADYQEEVMQIPKDKAGLIIGRKGWRKEEIMKKSGVKELIIREDQVHLRGTEEQCSTAKTIIDRILKVQLFPIQFPLFRIQNYTSSGFGLPSFTIGHFDLFFFRFPESSK